MTPDAFDIVTVVALFAALFLLGFGYYEKTERRHLFRIGGWVIFGAYWLTYIPFYLEISDFVNVFFCFVAFPVFLYFAYHEYLSYQWKEDPKYLRFMTGAAFVAGIVYFGISHLSFLASGIIYSVAVQSAALGKLLGMNVLIDPTAGVWNSYYAFGNTETGGVQIYLDSAGGAQISDPTLFVTIIFACTAIQSIMIFAAAIFAAEKIDTNKIDDKYLAKKISGAGDLRRRKMKTFLLTVPVIYVLNLVRNVGVMYGMFELGLSFEVVHNYVAKTGSLIAMVVLAVIVFRMLPEVQSNILNLFSLPKRKRGVNVG